MQRHRHQEFIRFLNAVEKTVPAMHVILDNYAAHKHPKVIAWLTRHPRVTFHFTPTSASWLNAVEGFFATLTKRRLRRGSFGIASRPRSTATSPSTMPTPSPSDGKPIPIPSPPPQHGGTRRWIQSTKRCPQIRAPSTYLP